MSSFIDNSEDVAFLVGGVKNNKLVAGRQVEVLVATNQQMTFDSTIEPFLRWITTPRTETEVRAWELENLGDDNNEEHLRVNQSGIIRRVPGGALARTKLASFQGLRLVPLGVTVEHPSDGGYIAHYPVHRGIQVTWETSNVLAEAMYYDPDNPNRFADFPTKVMDSARKNGLELEEASQMALTGLAELLAARLVRFEFAKESIQDSILDKFRKNLGLARLWAQAEPLYPMIRP